MKINSRGYQEEIEAKVKEVITDLLKDNHESLDLDKSFLELGINSVLAVELVDAVNLKLGIELGIEVIFDYTGVKELVQYIISQYGQKIEESSNHHAALREKRDSDIAIIGLSGKFAGSDNIEEFWEHLQAGDSCIGQIRRKGWIEDEYYDSDPDKQNKSVSKWGGILENIDKFDSAFFNISPLEARRMDPQQRLFLEEAYKAIEDSGYSAEQLSGKKMGVFVGGRTSDYKDNTLLEDEINAQTFLGNDMSILAARISYFLNFKGPCLAVDTACSSSLVAIHLACESIRRGESELALAGGVFVLSSPEFYVMASKTGMLSPDGKCKTFDNTANGIVVGEGVGALILKPLEVAIEDGDYIYGVIKGSAINQDGRTKGITAPSMLSQKELLYEAYKNASINPETVSYIEAHGTGTKLGDPIEIKALTEAFRMFTDRTQFCAIGSHKPNFGHTIMSAGIAGIFKILMAMKYRKIPPTINLEEVNEHIDFDRSPFFINKKLREWNNHRFPLRAGVSSFGFSGTNCHVIIEEPPVCKNTVNNPVGSYYPFMFSARSKNALSQKVNNMAKWLEKEGENYSVEDISYTLLIGRSHFSERCVFMAKDIKELKQSIKEANEIGTTENYFRNEENNSFQIEPLITEYGKRIIEELKETSSLSPEVYKAKLLVLADLYVKGYPLNWQNLFIKGKYHRIPVPTYPFTGESYWIPKNGKKINILNDDPIAPSYSLLNQSTSKFTEKLPPMQSTTTTELSYLNRQDEPKRISLQSLSNYQIPSNNLAGQTHKSITFSLTSTSLSQPRIMDESKHETYVKTAVSAESLQKELSASLAEALYMKLCDVDVDKNFIDMGMDSIIGVEWIRTINRQYGTSITATKVYDYPSIGQFAGFLEKELKKSEVSKSKLIEPQGHVKPLQSYISAESLQKELSASLAEALYMKLCDVDVDKNFIDMGMDSIIGVEWVRAINRQYGTSITATKVYDYPSIGQFAGFLEKELHKHGGGLKQKPLRTTSIFSLDEVLQKVQQGILNIEQADQLLNQFNYKEEQNEEGRYF